MAASSICVFLCNIIRTKGQLVVFSATILRTYSWKCTCFTSKVVWSWPIAIVFKFSHGNMTPHKQIQISSAPSAYYNQFLSSNDTNVQHCLGEKVHMRVNCTICESITCVSEEWTRISHPRQCWPYHTCPNSNRSAPVLGNAANPRGI